MKLDNFLKGPLTSALGFSLMVLAGIGMYVGKLPVLWEGPVVLLIGFALLFMRDELPAFIKRIFQRKIEE